MPTPTVLLVQPDPAQARRLEHLIHDLGHDCQTVRDGEAALASLGKVSSLRLIVLELSLPGMDGFEFLEAMRKLFTQQQLTVVIVSAYSNLFPNATRLQRSLGIRNIESSKATALALHALFEEVLQTLPVYKASSKMTGPPGPKVASLKAPTAIFQQLAQQKEVKRLARVAALHLTQDLPQDEALQKLVGDIAQAFDFPVVLISLALKNARFFKAHLGYSDVYKKVQNRPHDWDAFVNLVEDSQAIGLSVVDARQDPNFKDQALVQSGLVVSYTSIAIINSDQTLLGALCLIDQKSRQISPADLELLNALAKKVGGEITLNQQLQHLQADRSQQTNLAVKREAQLKMLTGVLETLHLGVLLHDKNRKIVLANERLCQFTGLDRVRIEEGDAERFFLDLLELFADPDAEAHRMRVLEQGPYEADEVFELVRPQRRILRWTARPVYVSKTWYQMATWEDLTAEVDLEAQRESLATVDPVTTLLNRRGAEEAGAREAERARRRKRTFSIVRLQLNGLKELNAKLGHAQGDVALRAVGEALRQCLRLIDRPARWSGRQFMIILPETDELGSRLVTKRMSEVVTKLDLGVPLSLSFGIAFCSKDPDFKICLGKAESRLALAVKSAPN